jgi:cullin 3
LNISQAVSLILHVQVEDRLAEEQARCAHYLLASTTAPLIAILDSNLLSAHLHTVLRMPATGLIHMIDTMRIPDLQRIYRLYGRANVTEGLEVLMAELKKYVSTRGFAINENVTAGTSAVSADVPSTSKANTTVLSSSSKLDEVNVQGAADKVKGTSAGNAPAAAPAGTAMSAAAAVNIALRWVQEVLDLKDTFDKVWKEAFEEDKAIQTALNDVSVLWLVCIFMVAQVRSLAFRRHSKALSMSTRKRKSTHRCSSTTI